MTLEQAMAIIARVQQGLVANGFPVGAWGPCGDGVDGRWGPDSRTGWGEAMSAYGYEPSATTALLATLGVSEFDGSTFQTAINTWNSWRSKQTIGSVAYEVAATRALAEATGITSETCPGTTAPETSMEPTPDVYYPQPLAEKKGVPWWLWLILGLVIAGAAGGGIWYATKYKKTRRRKKKKRGTNGYSKVEYEGGPEVTDEEFGGDDDDEMT